MYKYQRMVNYHETDKMGVTHHSNYIKYLEEARIAYLDDRNIGFDKFEASGISSPILGLEIEYKHFSGFHSNLTIETYFTKYTSVTFEASYIIKDQDGNVCCKAKSRHCFTDGKSVISIKKSHPQFHEVLTEIAKCDIEEYNKLDLKK